MDLKIKRVYCLMLSQYPFQKRAEMAMEVLEKQVDYPSYEVAKELKSFWACVGKPQGKK